MSVTGTDTPRPKSAGTQVFVGAADQFGGSPALGLDALELDRVFADTLVIGRDTGGAVHVLNPISRPASTNVQLVSGADVTTADSGSLDTAVGALLVTPGTDVGEGFRPSGCSSASVATTRCPGSTVRMPPNLATSGGWPELLDRLADGRPRAFQRAVERVKAIDAGLRPGVMHRSG